MRAAWQRTRDAGIPFDAQWGDIDYMDRRLDFTVNPNEFAGLQEFVETIHEAGMRFVPLLDPAMCVWPDDPTYFPDFTFYYKLNFDGILIDMNEPANFVDGCANNSLNYPPYKPHTDGPDLLQKTICLDAEQFWGSHYDTQHVRMV